MFRSHLDLSHIFVCSCARMFMLEATRAHFTPCAAKYLTIIIKDVAMISKWLPELCAAWDCWSETQSEFVSRGCPMPPSRSFPVVRLTSWTQFPISQKVSDAIGFSYTTIEECIHCSFLSIYCLSAQDSSHVSTCPVLSNLQCLFEPRLL